MLKRYFLSNFMVMMLLNVLVKPIWIFLIDRNVQLTVGHTEYGLYSALLSLTLIFSILLDLGITNYNNRHISTDNSLIHLSLPNMIVAKSIFSIFYFIIIFFVAFLFNYSGKAFYMLFLLGGIQMLNSFLQFLRSNVSANHDFKIDSVLSVLDKLVMIIVCGYLLLSSSTRNIFVIEWYLYAQIVAYLIAIFVSLIVIMKRYSKISFQHFSWLEMKSFCLKSIPYAFLILLMGIYMRSDSLLLERIDGPEVNSRYAEAYRILDALNMIGFLLAGILLPMFTRLISKKMDIIQLVKISVNIIFSISLCILAHSLIYSQDIMHFLDKNASSDLPTIYIFVISCFPAFCLTYIYSTLLTANGDIYLLIKIALVACILSIGTNLILIPLLHAVGTGIAALVVQMVYSGLCVFFSVKRFQLPFNLGWLLKFAGLFIFLIVLNFFFKHMGISLIPSIFLNMALFFGIVYGIKLWDIQTILGYFKQYKSNT